ncbi:UDP-phosphate galactose phosphotransferase [Mycobacterium sp. djl-10]|nr:UDP-phosphate galactose phosphotransferase [Mycobacterium sp. djl-10]MCV7185831.1 sugar transferase [Mycolicibacterium murale]
MAPRSHLVDSMPVADVADAGALDRPALLTAPPPARHKPRSVAVTLASDVLTASASLAGGFWWASLDNANLAPAWLTVSFVPLVVLLLGVRGVYQRRLNSKFLNEIGPIETTIAVSAIVWLAAMVLVNVPGRPGKMAIYTWIFAALLIPLGRFALVAIRRLQQRTGQWGAPTLIVGNGRVAHQIIERLESSPEYGLHPIGLLDDEAPNLGGESLSESAVPYIGTLDDIDRAVTETGAENIFIAFSRSRDQAFTDVVHIAHRRGLRVWVVPRMFDTIGERARIEHIGGLPVLALSYTNPNGWQFTAKHASDRILAGLGLLVISPLFLTLMLLVKLSSPGPIFFQQERVGRDGRVFGCLKFRSMRPPSASDARFELITGAAPGGVEGVDRRTKVGKFMRATSLDELPQLINVLRGEMSLVGPRPERPDFVELFEMQIRRYGERHRVKAGVTGWAQVHGLRGQTSIADRAEWDNYYIENWSLGLDVKILLLTVAAVFRGSE